MLDAPARTGAFFWLKLKLMLNLRGHWRLWLIMPAVPAMMAVTVLAYSPGLTGDFMFDDIPNIVFNPAFPVHSLSLHALLNVAFSSHSGPLYRPLSMLSFALDNYFFGPGPYAFKLTNLLIHVANTALIFWLSWRLVVNCKRRYEFDWSDRIVGWASVLTATAWALHPLNLTAVLYIVQRMTSLAALFTIAGMLAYIYGRERSLSGKTGWPLVWILTPCLGVLGVLSKEDAALLPLLLVIIEWLIFGFCGHNQRTAKNITVFYMIGLVLPGLIGIAYLVHHHFWTGYAGRGFSLSERVLTEFRVVFLYVKWTFIPDIRELALYHDDLVVSTGLLHPVTTVFSLFTLIGILVLAFWQRQKRPLFCLGILLFFAGQMMESTVLPLELAFEHRNYLPDYGLILALFSLLLPVARPSKPRVRQPLRWMLACIMLPVLFGVTFLRAWEWKNPLSFAYYEALHHPRSQRAVYSLGQAYSNLALHGSLQNPELAIHTLEQAASVSNSIMPDVALMMVSAKLKLPVDPAWAQNAKNLLQHRLPTTQDTSALFHLVMCLPESCDKLAEPTGALITAALHAHAGDEQAAQNPDLWSIYAQYLTFTGHPLNQVLDAIRHSIALAPKEPQYHINLAKGLIIVGDFAGAEQQIATLRNLNFLGHLDRNINDLEKRLSAAQAQTPNAPTGGRR